MAYTIKWSEEALEDLQNIIYYLETSWSVKIADDFEEEIKSRLKTLTGAPLLGKASLPNKEIRFIVVTKHNKLYYRIKDDLIILLGIVDTRQNPSKNKYEKGI